MLERKIIFKDGAEELILPVTPPSFNLSDGIKIETVNITNLGDTVFGGHSTISSFNIESFFPAREYDFASKKDEPYGYVNWFIDRSWKRKILRFIVVGTGINIAVLIENIDYGEKDGSGDVYYTLSLQRYKDFGPLYSEGGAVASTSTDGNMRPDDKAEESGEIEIYTVVANDTLWGIAEDKYKDGNLWPKLQKYNKFTSTTIYEGGTVSLPPKSVLEGIE